MRDIKQDFDQFWDGVSDIVISLIHSDYTSTDTFLSNFAFVKERYFKFNDTLSPEDRTWLAENHLPAFVNLMQVEATVAAIGSTLEHVTRPQARTAIH